MHRRCCVFLLIQEDIPLPARVSGINGQFAAALYRDSVRSGNFAANCEQLTTFANALTEIDPFVRRVFESTSYAPEDCWEGLALLIGEGKLGDFDSLSDIAREVIIADKENMPKFEAARKAFAGFKPTDDVGRFLGGLCEVGRLDLFTKAKNAYFNLVKAAGNGVDVKVVSAVVRVARGKLHVRDAVARGLHLTRVCSACAGPERRPGEEGGEDPPQLLGGCHPHRELRGRPYRARWRADPGRQHRCRSHLRRCPAPGVPNVRVDVCMAFMPAHELWLSPAAVVVLSLAGVSQCAASRPRGSVVVLSERCLARTAC